MAYLPVLWFLLAAAGLLALAGWGAAGNWRGALRYMRAWGRVMVLMIAVAGVVWLVLAPAITPP
jgi:hypothetical protein